MEHSQHPRPAVPPGGCKNEDQLERDHCPLQCKFNFFESDELTIHTFELKCLDCGWRDTIGYRSDDEDDEDRPDNPSQCPFCQQCDLTTGINPCQTIAESRRDVTQ